jgi:hypothetical protein
MTAPGDGGRRWDEPDLERVEPMGSSEDVTPTAGEPLGGDSGGLGQYTPMGQVHQEVSFARALADRFGVAGRILVALMLVVGVALIVVPAVLSLLG